MTVTGISQLHFGAVEEKNAIWEGSHAVDWAGGLGEDNKAMTALSWGGYDWSTVEEGTKIVLEFTPTAEEVQIRFSNGSWAAHPGTPDPYKLYGESSLEIELTKEILDNITNDPNSMLIIPSQNMIMYFFDYAGQSDTYFLNVGHVFGENMDRPHKLQKFNTFNGNDIDKLIANNSKKNIYIISWGEPVLNTTTEKLDTQVGIVFSKVKPTNTTSAPAEVEYSEE